MKRLILTALMSLILAVMVFGQRDYTPISYPCPNVSASRANLQFLRTGDINFVPCPTKTLLINGLPIAGTFASLNGLTANVQVLGTPGASDSASWSSAGSTHTLNLPIQSVTGAGRVGFIPAFSANNILAKSDVYNSTDMFGVFEKTGFAIRMKPSTSIFSAGNSLNNKSFEINNTLSTVANDFVKIGSYTAGSNVIIGDFNTVGGGTRIALDDIGLSLTLEASTIALGDAINGTGTLITTKVGSWIFRRTVTPIGTTGNVTIDRPVGTVNIAAAGTSAVVTNSTVSANSIVFAVARTNDSSCSLKNVVPAAGSFTINTTAACTATTSFGFQVTN
jgi:hypothetical protein